VLLVCGFSFFCCITDTNLFLNAHIFSALIALCSVCLIDVWALVYIDMRLKNSSCLLSFNFFVNIESVYVISKRQKALVFWLGLMFWNIA